MKITKQTKNGDFQQLEIRGDNQKILDFIVDHEKGDLLEDLKKQPFVSELLEGYDFIKASKNHK